MADLIPFKPAAGAEKLVGMADTALQLDRKVFDGYHDKASQQVASDAQDNLHKEVLSLTLDQMRQMAAVDKRIKLTGPTPDCMTMLSVFAPNGIDGVTLGGDKCG